MEMKPIGVVRTPHIALEGMPIQPPGAGGVKGTVEVFKEFQDGLKDLDGFSHIILLYVFHRSSGFNLEVVPFLDKVPRGIFATRAPKRPNPIGLSIVVLERIENHVLYVDGIDVLDGTPLLDIKPYVPKFDSQAEVRIGWLAEVGESVKSIKSDDRFKQ